LRKHNKLKLLAEKVETIDDFKTAHSMGFDYFQGYFFAKPLVIQQKDIDINYALALTIYAQVMKDHPDINAIARLFQLEEQVYIFSLSQHHIVSDGWSLGVFARELGALYKAFFNAFSMGPPSTLTELPIQYADFAHWQQQWLQGEVLETQLDYWKEQLVGGLPVLQLPTDRPRPAVQTFRGEKQSLLLPKELCETLKALSRREGVTLFMTLLAAFKTLLYRYTGQEDMVVGSPIAGRTRVEFEGLIGFFVNTLVLRTSLSGNPSFRELLGRVSDVTQGAYAHQDLPFEKLVEVLQPERSLSYSPLFQVMFVLMNAPQEALDLPGLTAAPMKKS
ncbi:hypothetical protein LCGC14_3167270, partial [marine sediment metagenome]